MIADDVHYYGNIDKAAVTICENRGAIVCFEAFYLKGNQKQSSTCQGL